MVETTAQGSLGIYTPHFVHFLKEEVESRTTPWLPHSRDHKAL